MVNAFTHGNISNDSNLVHILLEHVRGNEIKIVVEDMDAGFNFTALGSINKNVR